MVRSPRTQRVLLAAFAAMLAVGGAAFASTAGAQLAWQERDAVDVDPADYEVVDGEPPTIRVTVAVSNPTGAAVTVEPSAFVVFEGNATEADRLSAPRTARLAGDRAAVTVPAGGTATVTVVADVPPERLDRTRAAVAEGRVVSSGSFRLTIRGRSDFIDV
ncbi:hypothetical protein [Halobaculum sp. EA56]|uniref:hypothetical protein n=1 Tax=Halobaculum sp. EA56 TaxID=3421648 RepID=UPI003EB77162